MREGLAVVLLTVACSSEPGSSCGPTRAKVVAVTDGDTVTLADGEKIRYLLVDTNEITGGHNDCYGQEARILNEQLVLDKTVDLTYDDECHDRFGRVLAWVSVGGQSVNRIMVERGYACVLYIAPNGADERAEYEALEDAARAEHRGMWGACAPEDIACDQ